MKRWNREGWGNHPVNQELHRGKRGMFRLEDFPKGVSPDYLGGALFRGNFKPSFPADGLNIQDIEHALHIHGTPELARQLKEKIKELLSTTGIRNKYSSVNRTVAWEEAWEEWNSKIVGPLTRFEYLPPRVLDAFLYRPRCRKTGEQLWTQETRCYWYMLDNLCMKLAKRYREDKSLADDQYEAACRKWWWFVGPEDPSAD